MSTLTVTEVFDLLAETASCWCPVERSRCPKHNALKIAAHAETTTEIAITRDMLPMDRLVGYSLLFDDETPRVAIALLLWRVVAEFVHDYEPLSPAVGESITDAAERHVRENARAAEMEDIEFEGDTEVITYVLHRLGLVSDYRRVLSNDQHLAFKSPEARP